MSARLLVGLAIPAALALAVASCSLLVDTKADQCTSSGDCARFPGASCDTRTKLCVTTTARRADGGALEGSDAAGDARVFAEGGADAAADVVQDPCGDAATRPVNALDGTLGSGTLTCDTIWKLVGRAELPTGATLIIQPGTIVVGDLATGGTLVVRPGAKLEAVGTRDRPIVFRSSVSLAKVDDQAPGDWGGIVLLGNATKNAGTEQPAGVEAGEYGGGDDADSSGTLTYVRIEYAENGLVLAGVGSGTILDSVQVRQTSRDCFALFGGAVDLKHVICQQPRDDGVDWTNGYHGKIQFLVVQKPTAGSNDATDGLEGDNDAEELGLAPFSQPTIFNATLIGQGVAAAALQTGMLLKKGTRGTIGNAIVTSWRAGIAVPDAITRQGAASVPASLVVKNALYFANSPTPAGNAGVPGALLPPSLGNFVAGAQPLPDPFSPARPLLQPASALQSTAGAPPADGAGFFDTRAIYSGAFRDQLDDWAAGAWVRWSDR